MSDPPKNVEGASNQIPRPVATKGNTGEGDFSSANENTHPKKGEGIWIHDPESVAPENNIVDAHPDTTNQNPQIPTGNIQGHPEPTNDPPNQLRVFVELTIKKSSNISLTEDPPNIPSTTGPLNSTFTQDSQHDQFQLSPESSMVPMIKCSSKDSLSKGLPDSSSTQVPLSLPSTSMSECTPGYPAMKLKNWIPMRRNEPAGTSYDRNLCTHPHFPPVKVAPEQSSSYTPQMGLHLQIGITKNTLQFSYRSSRPVHISCVKIDYTYSDYTVSCDPPYRFHDEIIFHLSPKSWAGPVDNSHLCQPNSISMGSAAEKNTTPDVSLSGYSASQPQQNSQFPVAIGNPPYHADGVNDQSLHPSSNDRNKSDLVQPFNVQLDYHHENCETPNGVPSPGAVSIHMMQQGKGDQGDAEGHFQPNIIADGLI